MQNLSLLAVIPLLCIFQTITATGTFQFFLYASDLVHVNVTINANPPVTYLVTNDPNGHVYRPTPHEKYLVIKMKVLESPAKEMTQNFTLVFDATAKNYSFDPYLIIVKSFFTCDPGYAGHRCNVFFPSLIRSSSSSSSSSTKSKVHNSSKSFLELWNLLWTQEEKIKAIKSRLTMNSSITDIYILSSETNGTKIYTINSDDNKEWIPYFLMFWTMVGFFGIGTCLFTEKVANRFGWSWTVLYTVVVSDTDCNSDLENKAVNWLAKTQNDTMYNGIYFRAVLCQYSPISGSSVYVPQFHPNANSINWVAVSQKIPEIRG
uniref:Uncharacterized protein n=1 Tax=Caenorhabditis japonica TaxID=281687 RepID=A0A8R1I5D4_CAEJA